MKTNQDRVTQATKAVDLATESVAGLAENIRMKTSQQRKNEAQLTSIARQLTEAPVSERQLEEVRRARAGCASPHAPRCFSPLTGDDAA